MIIIIIISGGSSILLWGISFLCAFAFVDSLIVNKKGDRSSVLSSS